jgi:hypothetical protein
MDKEKYLQTLKQIDLRPKFKRVTQSNYIEEGTLRGIATIPVRVLHSINTYGAMFASIQEPEYKIDYIKTNLAGFKETIKKISKELEYNRVSMLKFLQKVMLWRFMIILDDKTYKTAIDTIIETTDKITNPDVLVKNITGSKRLLPEIYNAKHTNDLVKIIDKYIRRVDEIGKLIKKYPEKRHNFGLLLMWAVLGITDFIHAIHNMASYGAK